MHVNSNENTAEILTRGWQKNKKGTHRTDLHQFLLEGGKKMIFAMSTKQKMG